MLAFKPHLDAVLERLTALWSRQAGDRVFASIEAPTTALSRFAEEHADGFCEYPDPSVRLRFWEAYLGERASIEDDSVPSAYLSEFDQGLYGGLLGGRVQFMCHPDNGWISSMLAPILKCIDQVSDLSIDTENPWRERYIAQLGAFSRAAQGRFGISHFILIDSLNLIFELVGATETYRALLDRPDLVRQGIELAFDLNMWVQDRFFERVPPFRGGTFSNMTQWIPGRIISESVDPFHMTSVRYFEEWGRGPVERIFGEFDGGIVHIHGNGRHLLEAVSTLRGLKAIYLSDDRGYPLAFDILGELRSRTGDIPLIVKAEFGPFCERLERRDLVGGVFYRVSGAPGVDAANRCMEKVRALRTGGG